MSKTVSALSLAAVIVLLLILGGTVISLAAAGDPIESGARASVGTAFTYQSINLS